MIAPVISLASYRARHRPGLRLSGARIAAVEHTRCCWPDCQREVRPSERQWIVRVEGGVLVACGNCPCPWKGEVGT